MSSFFSKLAETLASGRGDERRQPLVDHLHQELQPVGGGGPQEHQEEDEGVEELEAVEGLGARGDSYLGRGGGSSSSAVVSSRSPTTGKKRNRDRSGETKKKGNRGLYYSNLPSSVVGAGGEHHPGVLRGGPDIELDTYYEHFTDEEGLSTNTSQGISTTGQGHQTNTSSYIRASNTSSSSSSFSQYGKLSSSPLGVGTSTADSFSLDPSSPYDVSYQRMSDTTSTSTSSSNNTQCGFLVIASVSNPP